MPADLFDYWRAYSGIKPFGQENRLLAQLCALTHNIHRGESPPVDTEAFLPIAKTDDEQLADEMRAEFLKAMRRNQERKK